MQTINDKKDLISLIERNEGQYIASVIGPANTGKTTIIEEISNTSKLNVVVLTPTNSSLLRLAGTTIHSFLKLPMAQRRHSGIISERLTKNEDLQNLVKHVDVFLIDNINQVSAALIDMFSEALAILTGVDMPFGGKNIVFFGDIYQANVLKYMQSNEFYFYADSLKNKITHVLTLDTNLMQDIRFSSFLTDLRLNRINSNLEQPFRYISDDKPVPNYLSLVVDDKYQHEINSHWYDLINKPEFIYPSKVIGKFPDTRYPYVTNLSLKVGVQVMFITKDKAKRWEAGSVGKVVKCNKRSINVEMTDGSVLKIEPETIYNYEYRLIGSKVCPIPIGEYKQLPIKLGWAHNVYKYKEISVDNALIDLTNEHSFKSWEYYLCMSKAKSLQTLAVRQKWHSDIVSCLKLDQRLKSILDAISIQKLAA